MNNLKNDKKLGQTDESNESSSKDLVKFALIITPASESQNLDAVCQFAKENEISFKVVEYAELIKDTDAHLLNLELPHLVSLLNDDDFHELIKLVKARNLSLGIIPDSRSSLIARWLKIPDKKDELMQNAFAVNKSKLDLIACNEKIFFGSATLGQMPFIYSKSLAQHKSAIWSFFAAVREIFTGLLGLIANKPFALTLKLGNDNVIKTAATGLVFIQNDRGGIASRLVDSTISARDGKLSVLVVSPKSIVEFVLYLIEAAFARDSQGKKLPAAVSYIRTDCLSIICDNDQKCSIDGTVITAREFSFTIEPQIARVNLSADFLECRKNSGESKNIFKTDNLPIDEQHIEMIQKQLPFFTNSLEEDFKELFKTLRTNAKIRADYLVMMLLSSVVAGLGLFLNSAAVIVGAMLLALLMGPIISLSMGLLRREIKLLTDSLRTIAAGFFAALATSGCMAWIIPLGRMTD